MQPHDDGYSGYLGSLNMDQRARTEAFMRLGPDERTARLYAQNNQIIDDLAAVRADVRMLAERPWWRDGIKAFGALGAVVGTAVGGAIQAYRTLH